MSTFSATGKRKAAGRVNPEKLAKLNPEVKKEALRDKSYWELYKNWHPINRWQWRKWEKQMREESVFLERINSLPVDQRYKLRKSLLTPQNIAIGVPVGMALYFGYCYFRYRIWGITPSEAGTSTARYVQMGARPPDL